MEYAKIINLFDKNFASFKQQAVSCDTCQAGFLINAGSSNWPIGQFEIDY